MTIDYTPVPIEVTDTHGVTTVYRSKYATCKALNIEMTSLLGFLRQDRVKRGRFTGYVFNKAG